MEAFSVHLLYEDNSFEVEIDPDLPLAVFKSQVFSLTGLTPDEQHLNGIPADVFQDVSSCHFILTRVEYRRTHLIS